MRRLAAALGAAALPLGLGAAWHRLWRLPLPRTSGSVRVRGLDAPVTVSRDRAGAVRVEARSLVDACFGQGFAIGQDRLFQLEFYRRAAAGRIAEFAGPEGVAADRVMRTLCLRASAEREAAALSGPERDYLEAYAAGINAAADAARALPFELQLLRIDPEPWEPVDSLAIGRVIALGFSTNMEAELFRAELVHLVGPETAARLEPRYPGGNPVITEPGVPWSGDALALAEQLAEVREAIGLSTEPSGSNNWAVAAHRSATGGALLAGDPHITTSIPDVWHTIELHAEGTWLRGGAMPGLPGLVIGQSPNVAWTFTNVMADVQDLYVEHVREMSNGGRAEYEHAGSWRPLDARTEAILVRGRAEPELLEVRETCHGPIVSDILGAASAEPLALCWSALREPFFTRVGVEAGSLASGPDLVERFRDYSVPPMNLVWADASGSIGYKLVGRIPVRAGGCPDLPKPGWSGEYDWDGYVPYDDLPEIRDPEGGVIVTANNRIAPDDYPHHITSDYLDGFRAARIEELLAESDQHTLESLARIQGDLHSIPGAETARRLQALDAPGARERDAIARLGAWDGELGPDSVEASIYYAFTVHFARAVSEAVIGHDGHAERWRSKSMLGFTEMISAPWRFHARLLELWEEADPGLVGGRDWDELALGALVDALDQLECIGGPDPERWLWGGIHGLRFRHPLGEGGSLAARALDGLLSRWLPAGGGQETVNANGFVAHSHDYTGEWAASYRLLCDAGDPAGSRWQHMTGQSGHPASPHYDDLLDDWLAVRSQRFGQEAVDALELVPGN